MEKSIKSAIGLAALAFALSIGVMIDKSTVDDEVEEVMVEMANSVPAPPIFQGITIEQSFVSSFTKLSKVSPYIATYLKSNLRGTGTFQLLDSSRNVLISQDFPLASLKDNEYFSFKFKSIKLNKGELYFLTLTSDVKPPATTFTLWSNQGFLNKSFTLKENGNVLPGAIVFNLKGK